MPLIQNSKVLFEQDTQIKAIFCNGQMVWPTLPPPDYSEPFYVENITQNTETLTIAKQNVNAPDVTVEYSLNRLDWSTLGTTSTTPLTKPLQAHSKIYLRANTTSWGTQGYNTFNYIRGVSKVGGNVLSLIYGSNFTGNETTFINNTNQVFRNLFDRSTTLQDAGDLILIADLTSYCYYRMFFGCGSLTSAPELPATTLAEYCYYGMFHNCYALPIAPALPATTLADSCYNGMFSGCTSLTTAPELPATTLANYCYQYMFARCTSLVNPPALSVATLASYCYKGMFAGCTSLVNAPTLPATTLADYCYEGMFESCTSLTTAPALPATTLADYCYSGMFMYCTSLVNPPVLSATVLAEYCYGTMFMYCTSLTTAPALPATTLAHICYGQMFNNCWSLTTAPELPATTLTQSCYFGMFESCTSLNNVTCLATDISADASTYEWLNSVSSTGTFTKAAGVTWPTGESGIPSGWTVVEV